jgi:hypothetical protein
VLAGAELIYVITVENDSGAASTATGVEVTDDTLVTDPRLDYQDHTPSQGTFDYTTGVWDVGSLAPGSDATLEVEVEVAEGVVDDQIVNVAEVTDVDQENTGDLPTASAAVNVGWDAWITVSTEPGDNPSYDLTFGSLPCADDGPGDGYDLPAVPPSQQAGIYARFTNEGEPLMRDIRDDQFSSKTWDVAVNDLEQAGFKICWDSQYIAELFDEKLDDLGQVFMYVPNAYLPTADMRTKYPNGVYYDMRVFSCIVDPADGPNGEPLRFSPDTGIAVWRFQIIVGSAEIWVMELGPDWNLVSIPGIPITASIEDLVEDTGTKADILWQTVYYYSTDLQDYILVDAFEFGKAYWVALAPGVGSSHINIPYLPQGEMDTTLNPTWNMVGSVMCDIPVEDIESQPDVVNGVYKYDSPARQYVQLMPGDAVEPGIGVWVATFAADTPLSMDCNGAPAPPLNLGKASWKGMINVQAGDQRQELSFGMHPSASEGFDKLVDSLIPPAPVWVVDALQAGWVVEDDTFPVLGGSYMGDSAHATWELTVDMPKAGDIYWNSLPTDYRCLLDLDGEMISMDRETSISLPAGRHILNLVVDSYASLPKSTELLANYPNPFNPETWIPFRLSKDGDVTVTIYDMSGRMVRQLSLYNQFAGEYVDKAKAIYWDGRNESGETVSSGIYFYSLQTGRTSQTRKLVIIR